MSDYLSALGLIATGGCEGYLFGQAGMYAPETFRKQMKFKNFLLVKIFLSGVGSSMLVQSLMSFVDPQRWNKVRSYQFVSNGFKNVIPGCLIIGVGMALSGSGPTIIPTQIGMHVDTAPYIVGGALAGGAIYALAERLFKLRHVCLKVPGEKVLLEHFTGGTYAQLALPMGAAIFLLIAFIEYFYPHTKDAEEMNLPKIRLLPILAGCMIGLNQIPIRYISGNGQGGSTAIMNLVSTLSCGLLSERFMLNAWSKAWQFIYVWGGTLLGGFISYRATIQNGSEPRRGFDKIATTIGAIIMVIGARIAGGCTCGHGVSGMSELAVQSMVGGMCIFAGGIATALGLGLSTTPK